MELKDIAGNVLFALETASTVIELVKAAVADKKNLSGVYLRGADLSCADLSGADLSDADLSGADLRGADLRGAVLRGAVLRGAVPTVPTIPNIHAAVYAAAAPEGALDMGHWHSTCGTSHCRAGWVVTLAGEPGKALETRIGTPAAAALIYLASDPKLERSPDFYCSNAAALADMKRLAETAP